MEKSNGLHHAVVVLQRFAHAHKHHAESLRRAFLHQEYLRDDFLNSQVASEAELTGQAECAPETAADLGGNAKRHAVVAGDEDAFDEFAVIQTDEESLSPICRIKTSFDH